jgi:uncharacterized phage protein gp47/JayE
MTTLPNKTLPNFVQDMVNGWAASLGFPPTFQAGDAFYALMETVSAQLVFIQAQIQIVNYIARAQTSGSDQNNGTTDADLDSFYAQFGFFRIGGVQASGQVTFSSFSPASSQVLITASNPTANPPTQGVIVQTAGGAIQYQVVADPNQPTWSAGLNAYVLAPGQSSLTASVQAILPGSAYNVTTGQLSQIATNLAGIDTVTNAAGITNGSNSESNPSFRTRFIFFINSLSKATYGAIASAILGVPGVVDSSLLENINTAGMSQLGEFIATIDDGSGAPPASLVTTVQNAINSVRGFTILGVARAVQQTGVTELISVRVDPDPVFNLETVNLAVQAALQTATNALAIGATLYISTLENAAMSVNGVIAVQPRATLINGSNNDLLINKFRRAFVTLNNIVVGNY